MSPSKRNIPIPLICGPSTSRDTSGLVVPIPTLPVVYTASLVSVPSTNLPPPLAASIQDVPVAVEDNTLPLVPGELLES